MSPIFITGDNDKWLIKVLRTRYLYIWYVINLIENTTQFCINHFFITSEKVSNQTPIFVVGRQQNQNHYASVELMLVESQQTRESELNRTLLQRGSFIRCDTDLFMQFVWQRNVIYNVKQLEEITIFPKDSIANKKNPIFLLSSMSLLWYFIHNKVKFKSTFFNETFDIFS